MGIIRILIAMALVGLVVAVLVKLLPEQKEKGSGNCDRCNGTGRIEELRGKVPCPKCKGTGKADW